MGAVTLDAVLRSKLNGLDEPLDIVDEAGRSVGHFLPARHYQQLLYRLAESQCPFDAQELNRMENEPGHQTLTEFWKTMDQP
jgi:hypothetical protein